MKELFEYDILRYSECYSRNKEDHVFHSVLFLENVVAYWRNRLEGLLSSQLGASRRGYVRHRKVAPFGEKKVQIEVRVLGGSERGVAGGNGPDWRLTIYPSRPEGGPEKYT